MRDVILRIDEIRVQKATGVMELVRGELNYRLFKRRVAEDEVRQHFERVPNYLKCSIIAYEHLSTQRVRPTIECVLRERRFETTRGTKQGPGEASAWAAVFEAPAPDCAAVLEIAATPNQGKNYHFGDWGTEQRGTSSALQFVVFLSMLGRVYPSEVVSKFEPIT